MAKERSGFFDAKLAGETYNRGYNAESFAKYFSSFIGNGVFAGKHDDLAVLPLQSPGMSVRVRPGQAYINGYWYELEEEKTFSIARVSGADKSRYDAIVVRLALDTRVISVELKEGIATFAALPTNPMRDSATYELILAYIHVTGTSDEVNASMIQDTRADNKLCGYVHGVVDQVSTTTIFNQLQAQTQQVVNETKTAIDGAITSLQGKTNEAVTAMNTAIDGTKIAEQDAKIAKIAGSAKLLNGLTEVKRGMLNDVKTPGSYYFKDATNSTFGNLPSGLQSSDFLLFVTSAGGYIRQELRALSNVDCCTYERVFFENTWSTWMTPFDMQVLAIANGGTGATSVKAALENFGLDYGLLKHTSEDSRSLDVWHIGKFIFIVASMSGIANSPWASAYFDYQLPEKYRPADEVIAPALTANGGSWTSYIRVKPDGYVYFGNYGNSGTSDKRFGAIAYMAKE